MILAPNMIVEETIYVLLDQQLGVMRKHWLVGGITAGGITDLEFLQVRDNLLDAALLPCLCTVADLRGYSEQVVYNPLSALTPVKVFSSAPRGFGTGAAGDPLPKQVSGLIAFKTDYAGPKEQGRMYVPFPSEGANTVLGKPTAAYQLLLGTLAQEWIGRDTIVGASGTAEMWPIIWHKEEVGQPNYSEITNVIARPYWATQMRRGDYGRTNLSPI